MHYWGEGMPCRMVSIFNAKGAFWAALATTPAETSAEAKEASIINKFSFSSFYYYLLT